MCYFSHKFLFCITQLVYDSLMCTCLCFIFYCYQGSFEVSQQHCFFVFFFTKCCILDIGQIFFFFLTFLLCSVYGFISHLKASLKKKKRKGKAKPKLKSFSSMFNYSVLEEENATFQNDECQTVQEQYSVYCMPAICILGRIHWNVVGFYFLHKPLCPAYSVVCGYFDLDQVTDLVSEL